MMDAESTRLVLVVEDDLSVRRPLVKFLEMHGFHVATADTADAGVDAMKTQRPAAAVVDLRLRPGSGRDASDRPIADRPIADPPIADHKIFIPSAESISSVPSSAVVLRMSSVGFTSTMSSEVSRFESATSSITM